MTAPLPPDVRPVGVIVPLPPSYRGGTEEYAYRLVREFSRHVPTQVATTTVRWNPSPGQIDVGQSVVVRLPAREVMQRPLLLGPGPRRQLWALARGCRVLQLHMPFPLVESPAVRAAHRAGVPTVLTYHMDADLGAANGGLGSNVITGMYRRFSAHPALEKCDVVVSNSRGYAEVSAVLSRHLSKVRVIAKGVDPARLGIGAVSSPAGAPPRDPAAPKRLVFVGRLVPYKGVPVLLEACAQLTARGRDYQLLIAGRGPDRAALETRARALGLEQRTQFLGFVPDTELGDLYRSADLVVVPSISYLESSATALEEAAACGVPVVGTNLAGAAESVPSDGVRGLLVTPGRPDELAQAMDRMLDAPRPEPPSRIRTWTDVAHDYLRLFEELGVDVNVDARPTPWRRAAPASAGS